MKKYYVKIKNGLVWYISIFTSLVKKKEEINKTNIYIFFLNRPCLEGLFGIVKEATPVVKAGRIRPGGHSLGTLALKRSQVYSLLVNDLASVTYCITSYRASAT